MINFRTSLITLALMALTGPARVGLWGDSRIAGAGTNGASTHSRSSIAAICPMLNMCTTGKWQAITLGADFTLEGSNYDAASSYNSFARGSKNVDETAGLVGEALKYNLDYLVLVGGYNSMPGSGSDIEAVKSQYQALVDRCLMSRVVPIIVTIWGSSIKSQTAVDAFNVFLRDLAEQYNLPLLDVGPTIDADRATYLTPNESPQVHWSLYGAKWFCAGLANLLDTLTNDRIGVTPFVQKGVVTRPAEIGAFYSYFFTATAGTPGTGFSGQVPTSWNNFCYDVTSGIDAGGTSVLGTASCSFATDPNDSTVKVLTWNHLTGAGSTLYPPQIANTNQIGFSDGDWLMFAMEAEFSGFEAGNTHFSVEVSQRDAGSTVIQNNTLVYRMSADAGVWGEASGPFSRTVGKGVILGEFKIVSGASITQIRIQFRIEQQDDIANASPGAYSGTVKLGRMTVWNLTKGRMRRPEA